MAEHDPLAAEFAALRTAVLVRPPGVRAAQATIRRRRHRTAVVMTSVVAFAVAAVGAAVAQVRPPHQEAPATQHTGTAQPTGSASELSLLVPGPTPRAPHQPGPPPPPAAGTTGPSCKQYGAVLLDNPTSSTVTVRADQSGLYPLCPGERVRVFVAVYSYDTKDAQHLFFSQTVYLDAGHNPVTLTYQVPACRDAVYVMSGNQTIRQSLPTSADPIQTGIAAYSSSQWGPYNGVVWSEDQNRGCPTGTP
ncbi:MAG: hypothetical protein AUG44_22990 [Actinobacteria bacterium 13_1_20CM_3_71_11]|nr:MAG: hypothetical protein AUG44_22990 [Actinobacteria bacterium 13_1_20CM_3_71_11]